MAAALMGLGSCIGPAAYDTYGDYEVDVLEDEAAVVVTPPDGEPQTRPRSTVPPGAQEGDVVVDGRVDPVLTAQLRDEVRTARERLHRVPLSPGGTLDLDDDGTAEVAAEPAKTR